jgi:hypothetical protein
VLLLGYFRLTFVLVFLLYHRSFALAAFRYHGLVLEYGIRISLDHRGRFPGIICIVPIVGSLVFMFPEVSNTSFIGHGNSFSRVVLVSHGLVGIEVDFLVGRVVLLIVSLCLGCFSEPSAPHERHYSVEELKQEKER